MAFDLAAWAVLVVVACAVGRGALALARMDGLRSGDRFILGVWIGVVVLSAALLLVSMYSALTPAVAAIVAAVLTALGTVAGSVRSRIARPPGDRRSRRATWAAAIGISAVVIGAAALASDPVTLYDSLVYHVGLVRWLREYGIVPGVALIHNRLGHVSAWFTLAAPFDSGAGANRAANVPLGLALVMVGVQALIAVARVTSNRATLADWFLALTSVALIVAVPAYGAATPSPDVSTNILVAIAAWSLLLVSNARSGFPQRLVPFAIALGACSMKLFALPAVLATGLYAVLASAGDGGSRMYVRRALVCASVALVLLGPFITANLVTSGCPAYPSAVGCLDAPWSVGAARAADYAEYVRDVARWERRGGTSAGASLGWIAVWIIAHPIIAGLAVAAPFLARRARGAAAFPVVEPDALDRDGLRALAAFALIGIAFVGWQAPAPRFLYAFGIIVPALALSMALHERSVRWFARSSLDLPNRSRIAFILGGLVIGFIYALTSQKLNVRSAVTRGAELVHVDRASLLWPAAPEVPARLFRWRVNDVEILTPVPRPVADTLGYHSVIADDASFEKCSTAPLPCTPYLPAGDVRLRHPATGLAGGFVRAEKPDFAGRIASCVGELSVAESARGTMVAVAPAGDHSRCGDEQR